MIIPQLANMSRGPFLALAATLLLASCGTPDKPPLTVPAPPKVCPASGAAELEPEPASPITDDTMRERFYTGVVQALGPDTAQAVIAYYDAAYPGWAHRNAVRLADVKRWCADSSASGGGVVG